MSATIIVLPVIRIERPAEVRKPTKVIPVTEVGRAIATLSELERTKLRAIARRFLMTDEEYVAGVISGDLKNYDKAGRPRPRRR